jgi:nucleotide-binding universal stress UspA family protein
MRKARPVTRSRLFRSILCPIDFSEPSSAALRYAAAIAKRSAGRLHVLYVNDPLLVAAAAVALGDRTFASVALGELPPFVAKAIPAGTIEAAAITYVAETGQPDRAIVATAQRLRCDLIVVGTHGLSGADRLLIGSTTERLFRLTPVPLLAVPPPQAVGGAREPVPSWPGPAIMAPVDLRDDSESDVRDAAGIARAFGTSLVLVHVVPQVTPPPWYRADLSAHWRMRVAKAQRRLESLAEAVRTGVPVETRVVSGNPADEIAALAAEERIGGVVMHLRKGPGLFGSRAGSIAYHVLRHAVTPVLVMPDRARKPREKR